MTGKTITAYCPAKINLFLEITGRRPDGYHNLETVMATIDLCDRLTFFPRAGNEATLRVYPFQSSQEGGASSERLPVDEENLVLRAVRLFREQAGIESGVAIRLDKRIPIKSGLGGASSDAAAALRVAARFWRVDWPTDRLAELAGELGSDVPFFLYRSPALCRGRGEIVEPLRGRQAPAVVIAKPPCGLSTREMYSQVTLPDRPKSPRAMVTAMAGRQLSELGKCMFNRFQESAMLQTPWIGRLQYEFGRVFAGHQLSGSGSSYFGLTTNWSTARRAASILRARLPGTDIRWGRIRHGSIEPTAELAAVKCE